MRADTAPKSAMLAAALLAALALAAVVLLAQGPRIVLVQKQQLAVQPPREVDFPTFSNMCKASCNGNRPLEKCSAVQLSHFFLEYQSACETNKANCALTTVGCGGHWKLEDLM
mmetsp:Transcript_11970/g.18764  ORF Transcript_11970/g.18764 Transcript_11970/m.18764 type:complete len:113 (-) Transcript_11970:84-422(-)|eukprot:CAMPEP_0184301718 /NCGR_PEP_ID=MMETSP1049-20130417/11855_1 /TAXON_ID=77928 /ORGANISM="Proteomonas sulcata, Strain CCMP704" /LENGTH=112 /DNA_ID=CAMNT_0026612795 /DNA_START=191 /DNA_END=529 /DNA_ORIENTATION=+